LLAGEPGRYVVLARRHHSTWYVGAIHSGDRPRAVQVPCTFLSPGRYRAQLILDGDGPRAFQVTNRSVTAQDTIPLAMLPCGGGVIEFHKQ
jgi:hypothetical protein